MRVPHSCMLRVHCRSRTRWATRSAVSRRNRSLGLAQASAQRWRDAADNLARSLAIIRDERVNLSAEAWTLTGLAAVHLSGDADRARSTAEEAVAIAERTGTRLIALDAHLVRASALLRTGGVAARPAIERALTRATALIGQTGAGSRTPRVRLVRADLARAQGDELVRRRELSKAERLFVAMGAPIRADQVAKERDA